MPTALILDANASTHGQTVKSYFDNDKPSGWSASIYDLAAGSISGGVDQAIADGDEMIIRSETGIWESKSEWDRAWDNGIITVHSHGSNSNTELADPPRLFSAVAVGGESPSGGFEDERSFGPGLEIDAEAYDGSTAESWATPTVAALLARLYDHFTGSSLTEKQTWLRARSVVRQLALDNNDDGQWSPERGFGLVYSYNNAAGNFRFLDPRPEAPLDFRLSEPESGKVKAEWLPFDQGFPSETAVETTQGPQVAPTNGQSGSPSYLYVPEGGDLTLRGLTIRTESRTGGRASPFDSATRSLTAGANAGPTLTATRAQNGDVNLSIPAVDGAAGYGLEERRGPGSEWTALAIDVDASGDPVTATRTPNDDHKPYEYRMRIDVPSMQTFYSQPEQVKGQARAVVTG